ncbi:MAG: DUF1501 domain-containing protein, partial [Planctomycetaceae bacterium]
TVQMNDDGTSGKGRDHNSHGFSLLLAGGGIKPGMVYGATDDFGYKAVENPIDVHDLHATVLHLLGLDNTRLEVPGRKRLDIDRGNVITDIIS